MLISGKNESPTGTYKSYFITVFVAVKVLFAFFVNYLHVNFTLQVQVK